jgi:putative endonuclease
MAGRIVHSVLKTLDRLSPAKQRTAHLHTGERGEEAAYFHLRKLGYVMVARNYRSPRRRSEIDLIGWDKDELCFIEVKTRSSKEFMPAEVAVDAEKQHDLREVAREYMRKVPGEPKTRFDIISVYLEGPERSFEMFKNAFPMSESWTASAARR